METSKQVAKHFKEVYFGGNWTWSNLKDNLKDVTWQEATTKVYDFNTIAVLAFHINYYVDTVGKSLEGKPFESKDKLSFECPEIKEQKDWDDLLAKIWSDGEKFSILLEKIEESKWETNFLQEKYGLFYRNMAGIVEHTHYHLGQIALIKKIIRLENGIDK